MIIRPKRWYKYLPFDTKGIVIVEGAKFVLMGQLDNDSLFIKTDNKIEISVNYLWKKEKMNTTKDSKIIPGMVMLNSDDSFNVGSFTCEVTHTD